MASFREENRFVGDEPLTHGEQLITANERMMHDLNKGLSEYGEAELAKSLGSAFGAH